MDNPFSRLSIFGHPPAREHFASHGSVWARRKPFYGSFSVYSLRLEIAREFVGDRKFDAESAACGALRNFAGAGREKMNRSRSPARKSVDHAGGGIEEFELGVVRASEKE
jgi:hypothetical protein